MSGLQTESYGDMEATDEKLENEKQALREKLEEVKTALLVIRPAFALYEKVLIRELNVTGKIVAYYYRSQIEYNVRYFDDGKVQEVYFLEDELKSI
jgi:hypothetical protein